MSTTCLVLALGSLAFSESFVLLKTSTRGQGTVKYMQNVPDAVIVNSFLRKTTLPRLSSRQKTCPRFYKRAFISATAASVTSKWSVLENFQATAKQDQFIVGETFSSTKFTSVFHSNMLIVCYPQIFKELLVAEARKLWREAKERAPAEGEGLKSWSFPQDNWRVDSDYVSIIVEDEVGGRRSADASVRSP